MDEKQRKQLTKAVGRAIAVKRGEVGLSQEKVAEILGISREAVSRLETGVAVPSVVRLAELAEIFDCGIEELLTDASNRKLDQARKIFELIGDVSDEHREMLMNVFKQLTQSLVGKNSHKGKETD
ncbi:helix-turn-helix domain-containing protein [Collimonas silvisoli]|jgi:transcriptional regulator with XRE-family HTH domain|uniref:helix-turn-helix domain-containing protein n=1 Tax=Collimonas silvisoli TaxID=2825884 RepID=UPI001B8B1E82|nr:helix-turn-helix transcriptional regulator [Collimonas silvisoli]